MTIDRDFAPLGYYAVAKPAGSDLGRNICTVCDWRTACQDPNTDFMRPEHRCMSYPVVTPTGLTVARPDKQSVVFKRK